MFYKRFLCISWINHILPNAEFYLEAQHKPYKMYFTFCMKLSYQEYCQICFYTKRVYRRFNVTEYVCLFQTTGAGSTMVHRRNNRNIFYITKL